MFIIKFVKYFFQAILVYLLFIIIKILGLALSRRFFSFLFNIIGPSIKSEQTINDNLEKFLGSSNDDLKKKNKTYNVVQLWKNFCRIFVFKKIPKYVYSY